MNLSLNSIFRITGVVLMVISISMLPSILVSIIYDSSDITVLFVFSMVLVLTLGITLAKFFAYEELNLRVRDGFFIVTLCWVMSCLAGAMPFWITGSIPHFADAFFESCSGFSTTGASILTDIESLPKGILFWRSFTHWIGGMGILIFAIALMPSLGISGQNIAVSEAPGPSLDKLTPKMSDTAKTLYTIYILFTVVETILLMLGGMNLYDALIHTFGTVGTGGFSSYNASIGHFDSTYIRIVITAFMVMCGVNFNLYYFSVRRGPRAFFDDSELKLYLLVFGCAAVFIFAGLMFNGTYDSTGEAAVDSAFQTASILTTTGYASADYETWPMICQMAILLLMFMGGCSSSTSGGLKMVRILVVFQLIRRGITVRLHPNVVENIKLNGKTMPSDTASAIASHTFLYIAMIFVGSFIIAFENVDLITCFSSVITCLGNVGPGFGMIGPSENFSELSTLSKYLLSIYMIAGRLELYTLFILLTPKFWNQNH
ncbi:MAG: TrkH family potassium uptake protein [Bacillota bacterium]|nr:TrkH family potassium uptake protein [Bacillota bacterium]